MSFNIVFNLKKYIFIKYFPNTPKVFLFAFRIFTLQVLCFTDANSGKVK